MLILFFHVCLCFLKIKTKKWEYLWLMMATSEYFFIPNTHLYERSYDDLGLFNLPCVCFLCYEDDLHIFHMIIIFLWFFSKMQHTSVIHKLYKQKIQWLFIMVLIFCYIHSQRVYICTYIYILWVFNLNEKNYYYCTYFIFYYVFWLET